MILKVKGDIKPYYVQMMIMLFFPGSKFPENEEPKSDVPSYYLDVNLVDNLVKSDITIEYMNKTFKDSLVESLNSYLSIFTKEQVVQFSVGKLIYNLSSKVFGIYPPWGILTGVRPAKVMSDLLSLGLDEKSALDVFLNVYLVSNEKAELALQVSKNEHKILSNVKQDECGLYVSIPFCPTRCAYCSFISYATKNLFDLIPKYIDTLIEDIKSQAQVIKNTNSKITSIYIGGGTPTVLDLSQLEAILKAIKDNIDFKYLLEYTVEAGRPDTITRDKLILLKKYGVNRISVNPQTLNEDVLKIIGRSHTTKDFFRAYNDAKEVGFENINVDLIAGLPGDTFDSFKKTLDGVCDLDPANITVHTFCVKKSSKFKETIEDIYSPVNESARKSVSYAYDKLSKNGYLPYYMYRQKNTIANLENVGYAKSGKESIYNIEMMEETSTIFACGASSISKVVKYENGENKLFRFSEAKYPFEYIDFHENNSFIEKAKSIEKSILLSN